MYIVENVKNELPLKMGQFSWSSTIKKKNHNV